MENKYLINFSNHPSCNWSEKQKKEALKYGEIIDIPFPEVDAKGDENYIDNLSDYCLNKIHSICDKGVVTIHLMGELTLTFSLLKRLQEMGISCIASTSKRIVKEYPNGKKEVTFQFERFREYK